MGENRLQSLITAVADRSLLKDREANSLQMDARHEVLPIAMSGSSNPLDEALQSPAVFDISGVDQIRANYLGMVVEAQVP
jgi:hypothetical protein